MKKIFILEDQPAGLNLVQNIVKKVFVDVTITHRKDLQSIQSADPHNHDIAFIDLSLPDGFSFGVIRDFKEKNPNLPLIVTTLYTDDDKIFEALKAGAEGYLLKSDGEQKLIQNLKCMVDGEPAVSPRIARKLMDFFTTQKHDVINSIEPQPHKTIKEDNIYQKLTARETDVILLVSKGHTSKQVAAQLELSTHTINDNLKSIYRKLNANTRTHAVNIAMENGLI